MELEKCKKYMNNFVFQKFNIPYFLNKFSIFLVVLSFFISIPVFSSNGRYVRFEDFVFIIIILVIFLNRYLYKIKIQYPKYVMIAFIVYIFFTATNSIIRFICGYLDFRFLLYLIKQVQYFTVGVYIYSYLLQYPRDTILFYAFRIGILANFVYVAYQIITGNFMGWYGVSAIGLDGASASSGALFFAAGVYGVWEFINTKKITSLAIVLFSLLAVMAVISRTFIMGYVFFCVANLILFSIDFFKKIVTTFKINISAIVISIFIICSTSIITSQLGNANSIGIYMKMLKRVSKLSNGVNIRKDNYSSHISKWQNQPASLLWGTGWSGPEYIRGESAIGIDGQYVRQVIETGIFGSIIFLNLLFWIAVALTRNKLSLYNYIGLIFLFSFLLMAVTYDVFVISKTSSFFWIFLSMLYAHSYRMQKNPL